MGFGHARESAPEVRFVLITFGKWGHIFARAARENEFSRREFSRPLMK